MVTKTSENTRARGLHFIVSFPTILDKDAVGIDGQAPGLDHFHTKVKALGRI
jgi:hypothetical protein